MTVPCVTDWETKKKSYLRNTIYSGSVKIDKAIGNLSGWVTTSSTIVPLLTLPGLPFMAKNLVLILLLTIT